MAVVGSMSEENGGDAPNFHSLASTKERAVHCLNIIFSREMNYSMSMIKNSSTMPSETRAYMMRESADSEHGLCSG